MVSNFNKFIDRTDTNSLKWDFREEVFGREDIIPMWVADADWQTAQPIIDALKERADHGIFGYSKPGPEHYRAVERWIGKRYGWEIEREWIVFANGVIPSISTSVKAFADPGDSGFIQPPVYYPFTSAIENNDVQVSLNQLRFRENNYFMDFSDLKESLASGGKSDHKFFLLCNPHNPVGRVWTKDELLKLGEICLENDLLVISDEIHADFIYSDRFHTPFSSLSKELSSNSITLISPSKTFNIPGLQVSLAIIPDPQIRDRFESASGHLLREANIMGLEALRAAYNKCEGWADDQLRALRSNLDYSLSYFDQEIPLIDPVPPQGTYLLWLNCEQLSLSGEDLGQFFTEEAKVGLDYGIWFGRGGENFVRLNFACPRPRLEQGLRRMKEAVEKLNT